MSRTNRKERLYNKALADEIISLMCEGKNLHEICEDERFPTRRTVHNWMHKHPEFNKEITMARSLYAEQLVNKSRKLLEECPIEEFRRAEAIMKLTQWEASRLNPMYQEHSTKTVNETVNISVTHSDQELARTILEIFSTLPATAPLLIEES